MPFATLFYHTRVNGYSMPTFLRNANVNQDPATQSYRSDTGGGVWTNIAMPSGSYDDNVFDGNPIPIGFDWGWNGSTYSNWYLSTNGYMQFTSLTGTVSPTAAVVGIAANQGDLWFDTSLTNTEYTSYYGSYPDPNFVGPLQSQDFSLSTLQTTYKIRFDQSENYGPVAPGASDMWFYSANDATLGSWPHSMSMLIIGYTNTSGTYTALASPRLIKVVPWNRSYLSRSSAIYEPTGISSFRLAYLGTLKSDNAEYDHTHGVWQKNISWVDNGIQHDILRVVVRCGFYSAHTRSAGYRISLYKSGAEQKFSISLLDWDSGIGNTSTRNNGPYPMAYANTSLRAFCNWNEQTWESYDNGATWTFFNPGGFGTASSTVVNSGPPVYSSSANVSLQNLVHNLNSSRAITYSTTTGTTSPPSTYTVGLSIVLTLLRIYQNKAATSATDQTIMNICNEIAPDGYKYGDVNNSGALDLTDVLEVQKIYLLKTPTYPESVTGVQQLIDRILAQGPEFIVAAIQAGYIYGPTTSMDMLYSTYLVRTLASKSNVAVSSTINRGPLALGTVSPIDMINTIINFKPNKFSGALDENF